MSAYLHTPEALGSARAIIGLKIAREQALLARYKRRSAIPDLSKTETIDELLLAEARAAKGFWHEYRTLLARYPSFKSRQPHAPDIVNGLLDIGFHHLTNTVRKLLEQHDILPALGLLHVAHTANSAPLAYDLVELFRADIVDAEVLRFLHLKKKPLACFTKSTIPHFLSKINKRCDRPHYLSDFTSCRSYSYYMELQVLRFMRAVHYRTVFVPFSLPSRHDIRCSHSLTEKQSMLSS